MEPVQGLLAPSSSGRRVQRRVIPALAGAGHRRGAGGVVPVPGQEILGQLGLGLERFGPESGRGPVELLPITELSETDRFDRIAGLEFAGDDCREPRSQGCL